MLQESLNTSLDGPGQNSSGPSSNELVSSLLTYATAPPLGASQQTDSLDTLGFVAMESQDSPGALSNVRSMKLLPTGAVVPPPLESPSGRWTVALQTRQLWEGTVVDVQRNTFTAILVDLTDQNNPDEVAEFEHADIAHADRSLVRNGASFYLVAGSERATGGPVKNVSFMHFRRLPVFSRRSMEKASEKARRISALFNDNR
jgi:hypothetical protein